MFLVIKQGGKRGKRRSGRRRRGKGAALTLAAGLCAFRIAVLPSYALGLDVDVAPHQVSYERERTEEEWARLRDNVIEWDEIQDLVHEYNPTVASLWITFQQSDHNGKYNVDYEHALEEIEDAYEESMSRADGNALMEALAEMQYQASQGETMVDSTAQNTDRQVAVMQIQQSELTTTETIRRSIITMYSNYLQRDLDELEANYNESLYDWEVRKETAGTSTALNVLTAEETMQSAKLKLSQDDAAAEKSIQLIRVNLGYKYNDTPEICAVPEVTEEMLDSLDLDRDTETAIENNYAIRINLRKREVSQTEAQISTLTDTIENGKEAVKSDMLSRHQAIQQARHSLDQLQLDLDTKNETLARTQRNYDAGAASERDREKAEYNVAVAELNRKIAEYSLASAYYDYLAGVNGIASAGS